VHKQFSLLPLLFILTLSVLTPSTVLSTSNEYCIVTGNYSDEEGEGNQEKDIEDIDVEESEDEKKEHFFSSFISLDDRLKEHSTTASIFLIEGTSAYSFDIQLRPPEYLI